MTDDTLLTLDEACATLLQGKVKAATLEAAIKRGELTVMRLGRQRFVTPTLIDDWRKQCLRRQNRPVSGSDRPEASDAPRGSSSTEAASTPLDAALMIVERLKEGSRPISQPSTSLKGRAIPMWSR